jgi:hypothetical protein
MDIRQRQRERERAKKWWDDLSPPERFQLGDDFVLGCFDWGDWGFYKSPTSVFLQEVDYLRILWESEET